MRFLSRVVSSMHGWTLPIVVLTAALTLFGCDNIGDTGKEGGSGAEGPTLADEISQRDELSTFKGLMDGIGETSVLRNPEITLTVFAPANPAFETYGFLSGEPGVASSVLRGHRIVGRKITSSDLSDGDTLTTVRGNELPVRVDNNGDVFVGGAQVTEADIDASNGVAHVVDDVMVTAKERISITPGLGGFSAAITGEGLAPRFDSLGNKWTTFAPNSVSFDAASFTADQLSQILKYHVLDAPNLDNPVNSTAIFDQIPNVGDQESLQTLQGEDVTITRVEEDSIIFNGGEASISLNANRVDQKAANGLIHLIDGVLVPPSFKPDFKRSISYGLGAVENEGAFPDGVSGTVTFQEVDDSQTLVTLDIGGVTDTTLAHPAHIHNNSADEGGGINTFLSPIDGTGGGGTSARLVNKSFDELRTFDGYVNIHQSVANQGVVVSQGNIGSNGAATFAKGLDLKDNRRSIDYDLSANSNNGSVAPSGLSGTATFIELTNVRTFVQVSLDAETQSGATGASVSHPAHIHNNSAADGGDINTYLSPIAGNDPAARSGKIVVQSYDNLLGFDGHIRVHEDLTLEQVISIGDIGAND